MALNIITNSLLENRAGFENVFISPPASDSGLALGAAAFLEYSENGYVQTHSPFLEKMGSPGYPDRLNFDLNTVAELLYEGNIIGVCIGPGEIGPRALGHRSIIARVDDVNIRQKVSEGIKGREWYRPVAPVIADVVATDVLEDYRPGSFLSKYMLTQHSIRPEYKDAFKGVVHADGTVRPQVICADDRENRFLYELLVLMYEKYDCMGLINTSFNVKGRPIIHSLEDALAEGREMGLDGVWAGGEFVRFGL